MTKITMEIPDDLIEKLAASGIVPEETPHLAIALMRDMLGRQVATAGDGLGLSIEGEAELHESILQGIQAANEGRTRPLEEYAAEFEKRHDIPPLGEDRAAA